MDLKELRCQIDDIDKEILTLFSKRMQLCEDVARYKKENNLPIFQNDREAEVIRKIRERSSEHLADSSEALFSSIMDISKCLQQQKIFGSGEYKNHSPLLISENTKIACQGTDGANSQAAAKQFFGDKPVTFYHNFEDVFKAVESGKMDFGVLPIYNSTAGSVTQTYDLMKKYSFYIAKTITLRIKHCLAVKKGTLISEIQAVYSHPQALAQCSHFIHENKFKQVSYENTATAAKYVAESNEKIAAVCSPECAKLYGLEIIAEDISDSSPNFTRFICISKNFIKTENADIISVMLTIPNEKGSLYRLLAKFFANGLNLKRLESRPLADGSFNVSFYLDFEGSLSDFRTSSILKALETELDDFRFLGNFSEA